MAKRKKNSIAITERDYSVLRFLWKWKAISTAAIARKFFSGLQSDSAYRRLHILEAAGYIQALEVEGRWREVWGLADKGYKHIRPKLGDLQQDGYKPENRYHDFLVSAFHLGDWLTAQPNDTQTYSEQQLRRYYDDLWPTWVPSSALHRPDGYSLYFKDEKPIVVAFEAELSVKTKSRYESVVAFYDAQSTIQMVFWLVDSRSTLGRLRNIFQKLMMRDWSKHHFVLLSDFQKNGWQASLLEGRSKGRLLSDFLFPSGIHSTSIEHPSRDAMVLLDSRRRPVVSEGCADSENPELTDCVPVALSTSST